jgi:flagellar hook-associated protein FlgK
MTQVSVPESQDNGSFLAEVNGSREVRRGLPVLNGTANNQVKPMAGTETTNTVIQGIAQEDANAADAVRVAVGGQVAIARVKGTPSRGDYLEAKTGSTTDAENGSLEVRAPAAGDFIVARALESGTDQAYIKVLVMLIQFPS